MQHAPILYWYWPHLQSRLVHVILISSKIVKNGDIWNGNNCLLESNMQLHKLVFWSLTFFSWEFKFHSSFLHKTCQLPDWLAVLKNLLYWKHPYCKHSWHQRCSTDIHLRFQYTDYSWNSNLFLNKCQLMYWWVYTFF